MARDLPPDSAAERAARSRYRLVWRPLPSAHGRAVASVPPFVVSASPPVSEVY